jgi:protein tyrosine phosphatase (PTP) superfamily phosphohydrolase (DUF442 family)
MCMMSAVMDDQAKKWQDLIPPMFPYIPTLLPQITQAEIAEFRRLLDKARKEDIANNNPDCETESKKKKILELAEQLGIKIDFL